MKNEDYINEGLEFLSHGKQSGKVKNFADFVNEEETETVSDAPAIEPEPKVEAKEVGYGDQPFMFFKNGDTGIYMFKVAERGFVLTAGKFSKFTQPSENKSNYCVLQITELSVSALDQAVIDQGKFQPNSNQINATDAELTKILNQVSLCVSDYLQKNPTVTKFYDEIQATVSSQEYDNKFAMSMTTWPGGVDAWKLQVVEKGKMNTIQK